MQGRTSVSSDRSVLKLSSEKWDELRTIRSSLYMAALDSAGR